MQTKYPLLLFIHIQGISPTRVGISSLATFKIGEEFTNILFPALIHDLKEAEELKFLRPLKFPIEEKELMLFTGKFECDYYKLSALDSNKNDKTLVYKKISNLHEIITLSLMPEGGEKIMH